MDYIFIMNPGSGSKKKNAELENNIKEAADRAGISYQIYHTQHSGDGRRYSQKLCEKYAAKGEKLRIYGVGGDGTLNEMVNGCFGYSNVEVGMIPAGTGNDFVRNFGVIGETDDFLDIDRQIRGEASPRDLIKFTGYHDEGNEVNYCANMFNIGFDCNVVDMTDTVKKLPFISGSLAYLISVFIILIRKKGANLKIFYPNGKVRFGKILLIAIANGCYCGGGVKGVPYAVTDDGIMDVSIIKDISRILFIRLFPSYSKGIHMEQTRISTERFVEYSTEDKLSIEAIDPAGFRLCTDGEITTQHKVDMEVVRGGFNFIIPAQDK